MGRPRPAPRWRPLAAAAPVPAEVPVTTSTSSTIARRPRLGGSGQIQPAAHLSRPGVRDLAEDPAGRQLSRPGTCRTGGVVFDIRQPESAWSIHLDIYNYEHREFQDRCDALSWRSSRRGKEMIPMKNSSLFFLLPPLPGDGFPCPGRRWPLGSGTPAGGHLQILPVFSRRPAELLEAKTAD